MAKIVCFLLISSGTGMADNSVKMDVAVKTKHLEPGSRSPTELQERWLEIAATAFHLEVPASVRVEWSLYGVNVEVKAKTLIKTGEGTEVVELKQGQKSNFVTRPITFIYTPRQNVSIGSGSRSKVKIIEATGLRYHGWAVRAFVDGTLAGEAYSSTEIRRFISPP